jgi:hypothetical protein
VFYVYIYIKHHVPKHQSIILGDFRLAVVTFIVQEDGALLGVAIGRHDLPRWHVSNWWYTYPSENMSSSVGMMKFPIYGKIKFMFQTTSQ